jgi:hypothetical protein
MGQVLTTEDLKIIALQINKIYKLCYNYFNYIKEYNQEDLQTEQQTLSSDSDQHQ